MPRGKWEIVYRAHSLQVSTKFGTSLNRARYRLVIFLLHKTWFVLSVGKLKDGPFFCFVINISRRFDKKILSLQSPASLATEPHITSWRCMRH